MKKDNESCIKFLLVGALVVFFFFVFIFNGIVSAHNDGVIVRATNYSSETKQYTFSCIVPLEINSTRYWTVRPDTNELEFYTFNYDNTFVYTLDKPVMYHIGCQVQNASGYTLRGDFHIDRRTGPNNVVPDVSVSHTNGLNITATCSPPNNVTHYTLYW